MNAALESERPAHVPEARVVDFDMYRPPGAERGFHEAWRSLHAPGVPDIVWTMRNGGHWIATRGDLIRRIFADFENFSNRIIVVPKAIGELHKMIPTTLDPPIHRPYRALLNESFAPKSVEAMEPGIRATAIALTEKVRAQGHCNFTTAYADIFPIEIFMRLVNLPLEDAPRLKYWADVMIRPDGKTPFDVAKHNIYDYLAPHISARRGGTGTDLITRLANGQVSGRALSDAEAVDFAAQVMIAGLDTVVNFLGFTFLFLARNPEHRRELASTPAMIPGAIEELLRRFPIVTVAREVRRDMKFEGVELRQGEIVVIPTPLVGMDERLNPNALEVDFHRRAAQHVTFGNGRHICAGMHLARLELKVALEEWLARIPEFELAPGAELRFESGIVGVLHSLPLVWNPALHH
jgi:camphor 5-monooxygenase